MQIPQSFLNLPFLSKTTPSGISETAMRILQSWVQNIPGNVPGPYATDAAAATAGVAVGQAYYQTSGNTTKLVVRLT